MHTDEQLREWLEIEAKAMDFARAGLKFVQPEEFAFKTASRANFRPLIEEVLRLRGVLEHIIECDQGYNFVNETSIADIARAALHQEPPKGEKQK